MKKVFSCFSPKGSPNRDRNPRTTALTGNPRRLTHVFTWNPSADGPTSPPGTTWVPSSAPASSVTPFTSPTPTPVPSSAPASTVASSARASTAASSGRASTAASSGRASTATSSSTSREKSEEENDNPPPGSPATRARIEELTAEIATLNLNLGPNPIQKFPFIQLQYATENFCTDKLVGGGGFGKVYKANLAPQDQEVAVKVLNLKSDQGTLEFVTEVELLSYADHDNIVQLIGYCAENEHRMLVYEYVSKGSLEDILLKRSALDFHLQVLDWNTRVRIAYEVAQGLHYLHNNMHPRRIYRDLKCANILLGEGYTVKLSDFGCAKKAPPSDRELNLTRVLGTQGYLDPRYFATGNCTIETDIYSFGVVLLELVTGRKCIDTTRSPEERCLLEWVRRVSNNRARFGEIVDPLLEGKFHELGLYTLVTMARYCVDPEPNRRPRMVHIVDILGQLNRLADEPDSPRVRRLTRNPTRPSSSKKSSADQVTSSPAVSSFSGSRVTFRL